LLQFPKLTIVHHNLLKFVHLHEARVDINIHSIHLGVNLRQIVLSIDSVGSVLKQLSVHFACMLVFIIENDTTSGAGAALSDHHRGVRVNVFAL
jgi:hypothetical protein